MIKLSELISNAENPRIIKDSKFKQLVNSIAGFPKMMELRPIIIDETNTVLGGNMRLKALHHLGYLEIPNEWVKKESTLTPEEKREFIVKDNVGFGEWDYAELRDFWNVGDLQEWGLDIATFELPDAVDDEQEEKEKSTSWFLNIRCDSEQDAQELYERFIADGLDVKIVT